MIRGSQLRAVASLDPLAVVLVQCKVRESNRKLVAILLKDGPISPAEQAYVDLCEQEGDPDWREGRSDEQHGDQFPEDQAA